MPLLCKMNLLRVFFISPVVNHHTTWLCPEWGCKSNHGSTADTNVLVFWGFYTVPPVSSIHKWANHALKGFGVAWYTSIQSGTGWSYTVDLELLCRFISCNAVCIACFSQKNLMCISYTGQRLFNTDMEFSKLDFWALMYTSHYPHSLYCVIYAWWIVYSQGGFQWFIWQNMCTQFYTQCSAISNIDQNS